MDQRGNAKITNTKIKVDGIIPETGMELLKRMQKYEIQKVKNSLLKLEKEREIKIRKEIED